MAEHCCCKAPAAHSGRVGAALGLWWTVGALWLVPHVAEWVTGKWYGYFAGMVLAYVPGTVVVKYLTWWRCQPPPKPVIYVRRW